MNISNPYQTVVVYTDPWFRANVKTGPWCLATVLPLATKIVFFITMHVDQNFR